MSGFVRGWVQGIARGVRRVDPEVLGAAARSCVLAGVLLAVQLASGAVRSQERVDFRPFAGRVPAAVSVVPDAEGCRLELRAGRAVRLRDGLVMELGSTAPEGPGRIHALAPHPHDGRVFLAADRGLFVVDGEHDVLDAPSTRDGFPEGEPRGVHVDARGRLWLLTDQAFAVLDPRFFQGRTFAAGEAGLPAPPYRALSATEDGRLVLSTEAGGHFVYRPDRGPGPEARLVGAGAAGKIEGRDDGSASVEIEAEARGGARFRFRRAHHHLLYPLLEGRIHGLGPGSHTVHLFVEDRDLRSRRFAKLVVDVPYPEAFDTSFLPYLAVGVLLVVVASFLGYAALRGRLRSHWRHALLSAGLASWFGLMLLAGLLRYGKSWPFVGFSMYTETYYQGSVLYQPRLRALHADGEVRPTEFSAVGVRQDGYWQVSSEIIHGGKGRWRNLTERLDRVRPDGTAEVVGFQIVDHRIRLTADGPVDVAPNVLLHWREP